MYKELEKLDDLSLLHRYSSDPRSEEGQAADAVLRYRQYLASKFYNRVLIYITFILAIWGGIQSVSAVIQAKAALSSIQAPVGQPTAHSDWPKSAAACDGTVAAVQLKELTARIDQLESTLKAR